MALKFCDSFAHYATGDLSEKYTSVGSGSPSINATASRRGGPAFRASSVNGYVLKALDNQATWIVGLAFRVGQLPTSDCPIIRLLDSGTTQVDVRIVASYGALIVTRNGTPLTGGTSSKVLATDRYYFIEFKVTIANSIGVNTCNVRIDGEDWITVSTSQDTQNTANASANQIQVGIIQGGGGTPSPFDMHDLYICDGTGGSNNDFLGDCRVDALPPNADGSNSGWTPSTGADHHALVDDNPPNDDTDYLSTSSASARDSHHMGNLPAMTSPVIKGVMHSISARKDDAGTRQVKSLCKSSGTTTTGATQTLTSGYAYYHEIYQTDPNTAAAWTEANLSAAEFGVENV